MLFESTGVNFLTNPLKICHSKPSFLVTKLIHVVSSCMSMKLDFSIVQAIRGNVAALVRGCTLAAIASKMATAQK